MSSKQWLKSSLGTFFHLHITMLFIREMLMKRQWQEISTSTTRTASKNLMIRCSLSVIFRRQSVEWLFRVSVLLTFYYGHLIKVGRLSARLKIFPLIHLASSVNMRCSRWTTVLHARDITTIIQDLATASAPMSWGLYSHPQTWVYVR